MAQTNGHDYDVLNNPEATLDTAVNDIRRLASQVREQSVTVRERVADHGLPFDQKGHTLMMESVDRITQHWVSELNHVRENTMAVEQMVISQAAKAKDELTKLHLLGMQAMKEAQRGQEVVQRLGDELDSMLSQHTGIH